MEIRKIDETLSVAPQILPGDMAELAAMGFRGVICNRPDGEEAGQPDHLSMARAAAAAGLQYHFLPVRPGQLTPDIVAGFAVAMAEMAGAPVLAYCRSGTRSATIWALSQSGQQPKEDILNAALEAGYDLSGIAGALA
ncbi:MAG: TIGR01244 family sulfur transferase [Paracoccus sp. (in: a-proteobacteria)]